MRKGLSLLQDFWRAVKKIPDYPVYVNRGRRTVKGYIPAADRYYILDANVVTGNTIKIVCEHILNNINRRAEVVKVGTAQSTLGERVLDIVLPARQSILDKYAVFICGYPLSGKTMLARMLSYFSGFKYYKWSKYIPRDTGLYGERLAEVEEKDIFYTARAFVEKSGVLSERADFIVVDGAKHLEHIEYVSYLTRRPAIVVWVEIDSEIRSVLLQCRGDPDDKYDQKRLELFRAGLEEIRRNSHIKVDYCTLSGVRELLELLGLRGAGSRYSIPCPTKEVFLDILLHEVLDRSRTYIPIAEVHTSGSYARKLKKLGVEDGALLEHVENIRRGFKVIDDIIDEDTIRDRAPALWTEIGVFPALLTGISYLQIARNQAMSIGVYTHFSEMLRSVVEAVRLEIRFEEHGWETVSRELWIKAAEREACFRRYLALLSGRAEIQWNMYLDGLRAQMVDDVLGLNKEDRVGTEVDLNRPLITRVVPITGERVREVSNIIKRIVEQARIRSKEEAINIFWRTVDTVVLHGENTG